MANIEYTFPEAPTAPFADTQNLGEHKLMANLMTDTDVKILPHLFPTGEHGYNPGMKFAHYTRQRLLGADPRFEDYPDYIYFLLETWLKKRISSNTSVRISQQKHSTTTCPTKVLRRQVYTTLRDVPGTQPYVFAKKGVALSMFEQLGTPQWFLTLTCHARQGHILIACVYAKLLRAERVHKQPLDTKAKQQLAAWVYANYMNDPNYKWHADAEPEQQIKHLQELGIMKKTPDTNITPAHKRHKDENDEEKTRGYTANELCNSMPAIVARQFFQHVKRFLRWLSPASQDPAENNDSAPDTESEDHTSAHSSENESSEEASTSKARQDGRRTNTQHARHKWPPPFHVHDYVVQVESQKRGYPHVHMLLWTRERVQPGLLPAQLSADDVKHLTDDEVSCKIQPSTVEDLTDKYIYTTSPERWKNVHLKRNPERADYKCLSSLASLQAHHCNPRRQIVRQIRRELNLSDRGPLPRRIFRGDDGTIAKLCKDLGWHEKRNHAPSAEPRTPRTDTRETNSGDRPNTRTQKGKRRRNPTRSSSCWMRKRTQATSKATHLSRESAS